MEVQATVKGEKLDPHRRVLVVTPGNIRNSHLYVRKHYDFFPADCVGPPRKRAGKIVANIEIFLDGLNEAVKTDIGTNAKTGAPRDFFRGRKWVRRFFEHHKVHAGDQLALERLATRRYRLSVDQAKGNGHRSLTAAEFFAGIGLVRLALERQGWNVVFANDIDPAKAEMYRHNWPNDDHLVVGDIHKLNADDLPSCDLFTASFPCNDLSIAGRWEGLNGKESSAFWGLIRILREMRERRPPLVMLENVVGFLMSHGGRDLEQALLALNDLGYAVDAFILNAVRWTPQSRARLFVVAQRGEAQEGRSFALKTDSRPDALFEFINRHQDIRWHIQDLPAMPRAAKRLADIVEDLPDNDPHWWNKKRADYFMNQLSERHEEQAKRMIEGKSFTYATAFRRVRNARSMAELRTDGIAGCLRTPRGGSGRQILFMAGRGTYRVRLLTARECARLQGVPDTYAINVPLNQALFGFGDAVCVPAIEWIARNYLAPRMLALESVLQ
jgi:DNA (cytosine-5)-methyltransferase 1